MSAAKRAGKAAAVAPAGYDASKYPPFAVTVDAVVATIRNGQLCVLLIERSDDPHAGCWALPGGFIEPDEDADTAASRELEEECGIRFGGPAGDNGGIGHLEQLRTYSTPDRDPRMRVVTVAYLAVAPDLPNPTAGSDAAGARFWPVADLNLGDNPDGIDLAFDHAQIIGDGIERIRSKFEYTTMATLFCDETFTIPELRRVYECVWGVELDAGNFTRKVSRTEGFLEPADGVAAGGTGRPARLWRRGTAELLHPALLRRGTD